MFITKAPKVSDKRKQSKWPLCIVNGHIRVEIPAISWLERIVVNGLIGPAVVRVTHNCTENLSVARKR